MSFRKLLPSLAVFVLLFARASHAQLGLYGTFDGERVTGFTCHDATDRCGSPDGVSRPYGGKFGAFYDFRTIGRVRLGADLRGNVFNANKSAVLFQGGSGVNKFYGILGGVRATTNLPISILHPYAEVAAGLARSNADSYLPGTSNGATVPATQIYSNYTQVEGLVGLDITILPYLDLRAVEFGAGALFGTNTHSVESIGGGVVFHLPR
ncbi:MAG: hypothetical protein ACRYFU_18045 [Janthinobacterium lividum]